MILMLGATIVLGWTGAFAVLFVYLAHNKASIWDDKLKAIGTNILMSIPADT